MRIVVVGASLAGVRTVQALRRRGSTDEVVLVGAEPGAEDGVATDRPPLSKKFLADPATPAPPLVSAADLAGLDVRLVTARATDLDLDARRVLLHGGDELPFDALVVATGSTPRSVPGLEPRPGVYQLRGAADAAAIRAAGADGARVVVVGGGFIGAEVAWTLHRLGREVAVVEPLPTLMVRGLGPEVGAALTRRHAAAGVALHLGAGVAGIEGAERVSAVRLTDGSALPADVVVLGLGAAPETGWLTGSGLDLRDGVVCDEHLAARGAEGVYAVGDVARWYHPRYGEDVRVEHWTNAVETATVAAANLTGSPTVHEAVPYVWTEQLDGRLQVFGRVRPQDELRVVHGDLTGDFVALTGGDGLLQGVVGFGAVRPTIAFRKLLGAGVTWDEALAAA
ncbi:NAD(P)/FAD-dependent oxidoreductase [Geodermatophilus sp. TF02-6]|uniref:NAD(P)/FAD-dependent oxidoreductase n=1 Tax=Geodermatophilus sp. TF02-6 TaxID=2250575 RepID=UPI001314442F|nr:FAD-dependent oxidoreductase [Geodermatophilus sp. TF02-6]